MSIGNKIRVARENAGLTQTELGKLCGTTKQTIYKYEAGIVTNIPLDRIEMIATVLKISSASLLGWDEIEQPAVPGGLSDVKMELIQFVDELNDEQAALALRVLKSIVGEQQ